MHPFAALSLTLSAALLVGISGCSHSTQSGESASSGAAVDPTSSLGAKAGDRIDASRITLRSADNSPVPMSDLLEDGPIVVVFYRGSWCPYCERALEGWDDSVDRLNRMGGRLIALTPDAPSRVSETLDKQNPGFTVLSDANAEAARALRVNFVVDRATRETYLGYGIDLEQSNANGLWQLPHPGTFIIDTDGTVRYADVDSDYREGRADPAEVLNAYRSIFPAS
jgi:peroxiredoxin